MYKVFINEHLITLTNKITKEDNHQLFLLETVKIEQLIEQLNNKEIKTAHLYHSDKEKLLTIFKKKLPVVIAAGGLVVGKDNRILFIFRNGKWDLPKGKLDKGESIEDAAIREVEEETGVNGLNIDKFLVKTYHVFKRNGTYKLKETHWYLMNTDYNGRLIPQNEEGIELVAWKKAAEIEEALKNSYHNIKMVVSNFWELILEP